MAQRYHHHFENATGTRSYTWPTNHLESETDQQLATSFVQLTGVSFSVDQLGDDEAVKENASERVRFTLVGMPSEIDIAMDRIKEMRSWGRGKLWSKGDGGVMRWAWARMDPIPPFKVTWENVGILPVAISFTRTSDWFEPDLTSAHYDIAADPANIVLTNPGNATVYDAVFYLKGPFTNPSVTNSENGQSFASTTDAVVGTTWLRFDAARHTVGKSLDSGGTWADDSANASFGTNQLAIMDVKAGPNNLVVTGLNGGDLDVEFYGAWE